MNNSLFHWGIPGMKWGVRKQNRLSNKVKVFKAGKEFHNISAGERNLKSAVYTSHTKKDNALYRNKYSAELRLLFDAKNIRDNTLVAKKDIKVASEKASVESFIKLYKKDPVGMGKHLANVKMQTDFFRALGKYVGIDTTKSLIEKYSNAGDKFIKEKGYDLFDKGLVFNSPKRTEYFDSLIKQGFSAKIDNNDKSSGFVQEPLIFFKGSSSLKLVKSVEFTKDELDTLVEAYKNEP